MNPSWFDEKAFRAEMAEVIRAALEIDRPIASAELLAVRLEGAISSADALEFEADIGAPISETALIQIESDLGQLLGSVERLRETMRRRHDATRRAPRGVQTHG